MRVEFLSSLFVEEIDDTNWRLIAPFEVKVINDNATFYSIIVPQLFETDFASVPRLPFVFELYGDRAHKPAILHDYLYSVGGNEKDRTLADMLFRAAMIADGLDEGAANSMFTAVRIGGASHFHFTS